MRVQLETIESNTSAYLRIRLLRRTVIRFIAFPSVGALDQGLVLSWGVVGVSNNDRCGWEAVTLSGAAILSWRGWAPDARRLSLCPRHPRLQALSCSGVETDTSAPSRRCDVPLARAASGGGRRLAAAARSTERSVALAAVLDDPAFRRGR
jgi:hypothetical protein